MRLLCRMPSLIMSLPQSSMAYQQHKASPPPAPPLHTHQHASCNNLCLLHGHLRAASKVKPGSHLLGDDIWAADGFEIAVRDLVTAATVFWEQKCALLGLLGREQLSDRLLARSGFEHGVTGE